MPRFQTASFPASESSEPFGLLEYMAQVAEQLEQQSGQIADPSLILGPTQT